MSEIISFRLNEENPDEAAALAVLRRWQADGWQPRQVITRALLALEGQEVSQSESALAGALRETLHQAQELATRLRAVPVVPLSAEQETAHSENELRADFKSSVLKSKRPGIKLKE